MYEVIGKACLMTHEMFLEQVYLHLFELKIVRKTQILPSFDKVTSHNQSKFLGLSLVKFDGCHVDVISAWMFCC